MTDRGARPPVWREIRAHVNRTVAKAPPLTEDQRSRLAVLLRPS
jgi:hypothetical protein